VKRAFLDTPAHWLRAPRVCESPAEYACAVERFESSGFALKADSLAFVGIVICIGCIGLLFAAWPA
jgi:hypothetical protein